VVRALTAGPGLSSGLCMGFLKTPPVHPAVNGYLTRFRVGEGGEEEG